LAASFSIFKAANLALALVSILSVFAFIVNGPNVELTAVSAG
jgi:hypothetical protein